jgi:hypothetical protein
MKLFTKNKCPALSTETKVVFWCQIKRASPKSSGLKNNFQKVLTNHAYCFFAKWKEM